MKRRPRHYWIVKHGLDALTSLPNFIWRTGERKEPRTLLRVRRGDRWIGFAYTSSDARERPVSQVTGFRECIRESCYRDIPPKGRALDSYYKKAWMIEGRRQGWQPRTAVGVPPLEGLLGRRIFRQATLIPISKAEYDSIRREVRERELDPKRIPVFGREPRYEQEVIAIIACGHRQLGIEKILRLRTAFPDMTVKLRGRANPVHLEVEVYSKSFLTHGHARGVDAKGHFEEIREGKSDKKPVGLLCWVNDENPREMTQRGIRVSDTRRARSRLCSHGGHVRKGRYSFAAASSRRHASTPTRCAFTTGRTGKARPRGQAATS